MSMSSFPVYTALLLSRDVRYGWARGGVWIEDRLVSSLTNHLFQQRNFVGRVWLCFENTTIFDRLTARVSYSSITSWNCRSSKLRVVPKILAVFFFSRAHCFLRSPFGLFFFVQISSSKIFPLYISISFSSSNSFSNNGGKKRGVVKVKRLSGESRSRTPSLWKNWEIPP